LTPQSPAPKNEQRTLPTDEDTQSEGEGKHEEAKKSSRRSRNKAGKPTVVTPYLLFYRENAHFFRKQGYEFKQMSTIMANAWKQVPDDMKRRYRERADAEK